jgi:hypothetical protein
MSSESNTGSIGDNNHRFWYKEEEMNSKILLRGRCVHSCWANGFLRGRALSGVGSFKKHLNEEKKKIDARSTCMSVPPPPASGDEMIPAEPPGRWLYQCPRCRLRARLAVQYLRGLRMLSEAAASMPSADDTALWLRAFRRGSRWRIWLCWAP